MLTGTFYLVKKDRPIVSKGFSLKARVIAKPHVLPGILVALRNKLKRGSDKRTI